MFPNKGDNKHTHLTYDKMTKLSGSPQTMVSPQIEGEKNNVIANHFHTSSTCNNHMEIHHFSAHSPLLQVSNYTMLPN